MITRGDLYRVRSPRSDVKPARTYLVVSREDFLVTRYSTAICVPIYTAGGTSECELRLGEAEGLKHISFARCDEMTSVRRDQLTDFVGTLASGRLAELNRALAVSLVVAHRSNLSRRVRAFMKWIEDVLTPYLE